MKLLLVSKVYINTEMNIQAYIQNQATRAELDSRVRFTGFGQNLLSVTREIDSGSKKSEISVKTIVLVGKEDERIGPFSSFRLAR